MNGDTSTVGPPPALRQAQSLPLRKQGVSGQSNPLVLSLPSMDGAAISYARESGHPLYRLPGWHTVEAGTAPLDCG